jgi:hypothetical protein
MSAPGSYYAEFSVPVAFTGFTNPAEAVAAVVSSHAHNLGFHPASRPGNPPGSHGIAPPANALVDPSNPNAAVGATKHCSVRGCSVLLSADAMTKMCDGCRERHREYALTKRRKRKAEKAAVLAAAAATNDSAQMDGMNVESVWEPQAIEPGHPTSEAVRAVVSQLAGGGARAQGQRHGVDGYHFHNPDAQHRDPSQEHDQEHPHDHDQTSWLDPALYTPPGLAHASTSSSELAGALTLPTLPAQPHHPHSHHDQTFGAGGPNSGYGEHSPSPFAHQTPEQIAAAFVAAAASAASNHSVLSGSSPSAATSPEGSASVNQAANHLPPRYCSVKGCKVLVPGDYLFKMCEVRLDLAFR